MDVKLIIFTFLIWNVVKLFLIKADPIIQVLNALLFVGIYFDIEDKDIKLGNIGGNFFTGTLFFLIIILRSLSLNSTLDKFYYFLLPFGIFSICLSAKKFKQIVYFRNIIFISLLLPLRRLFFYVFNPILIFLTKYLTFFTLFCLGVDPVLVDRSINLGSSELVISDGCGGADNLYFAISAVIIFKMIFSLRKKSNLALIYLITIIVPIFLNVVRNTLLALIITLDNNRDKFFYFFHDSYGSLLFSFVSLFFISAIYLNLLSKEIEEI